MKRKFYFFTIVISSLLVNIVSAGGSAESSVVQNEKSGLPSIVMIVKQSDPWFNDMAQGIAQLKRIPV